KEDEQFKFKIEDFKHGLGNFWDYLWGGMTAGGIGTGLLLFFDLFTGPIGLAVSAVTLALTGSLGSGLGGIEKHIKQKVFEAGWKKFEESSDEIAAKVGETINKVFDERVEYSAEVIREAISMYESLIEEEKNAHQKFLAGYEVKKASILQKQQKITQVQEKIEDILYRINQDLRQ
ncbi:MAG: hypothetical protein WA865_00480, partial [Spirulinaceae cyanobacterium]